MKQLSSFITHKADKTLYCLLFMLFNSFISNAPFLYPLKTSENLTIFWCFQRVEKGCIWNEQVKEKETLFKLLFEFIATEEVAR